VDMQATRTRVEGPQTGSPGPVGDDAGFGSGRVPDGPVPAAGTGTTRTVS